MTSSALKFCSEDTCNSKQETANPSRFVRDMPGVITKHSMTDHLCLHNDACDLWHAKNNDGYSNLVKLVRACIAGKTVLNDILKKEMHIA